MPSGVFITNACSHCVPIISSAISASEAAAAIAYNTTPMRFSVQMLVDCANANAGYDYTYCSGCNGGDPGAAFNFISSFTIPIVSLG